jgi:hypothetical protein
MGRVEARVRPLQSKPPLQLAPKMAVSIQLQSVDYYRRRPQLETLEPSMVPACQRRRSAYAPEAWDEPGADTVEAAVHRGGSASSPFLALVGRALPIRVDCRVVLQHGIVDTLSVCVFGVHLQYYRIH